MTKETFLAQLRRKLSDLPQNDVEERLTFYGEMIEDRIEDGLSEEDAVSAVGGIDEISAQIIADIPLAKIAKDKIHLNRRLTLLEIILLVLGAPIWLSFLIAAFAVVLSLYVSVWSVIISLWAVFVSLGACALGGIAAGIGFAFGSHTLAGAAMIGLGIVCVGLAIFAFFGCRAVTNGILSLTKKFAIGIKKCFIKKEVRK